MLPSSSRVRLLKFRFFNRKLIASSSTQFLQIIFAWRDHVSIVYQPLIIGQAIINQLPVIRIKVLQSQKLNFVVAQPCHDDVTQTQNECSILTADAINSVVISVISALKQHTVAVVGRQFAISDELFQFFVNHLCPRQFIA